MNPKEAAASPQPGVSGRGLTKLLIVALIVVGVSLSYALWSYNRVERARAATAESWRSLAEVLTQRYRQIELQVAEGVDDESIDMAVGERFRLALDRFRTAVGQPIRYQSAMELEALTDEMKVTKYPSPELLAAVEHHNMCLRQQEQVMNSTGGRLLSLMLNFDRQPPFDVR